MSKLGSLVGGLGMGAAMGYLDKIQREQRDERMAAMYAKQPMPKQDTPIEVLGSKIKGYFTDPKPAAPSAPAAGTNTIPDPAKPAAPVPPATQIEQAAPAPVPATPAPAAPATVAPPAMVAAAPTDQSQYDLAAKEEFKAPPMTDGPDTFKNVYA